MMVLTRTNQRAHTHMEHITFGTGRILVQRGTDDGGSRFIFLNDTGKDRPVGSTNGAHPDSTHPTTIEENQVTLQFLNIESARVLQDKLNLMISSWIEEAEYAALQE